VTPTSSSSVPDRDWIWISRWQDFQHYQPERDRPPAWIKTYPKQLDDWRYLQLTNRQRALLADLRQMFATSQAQLRHDRGTIEARRQAETRHADLEALNHAGFIEFLSRDALDAALEKLYASRAPARSRREVLRTSKEGASARAGKRSRDAPQTPDLAAALAGFVAREWEHYPDLGILHDELTDRGLDDTDATALIAAEQERRAR